MLKIIFDDDIAIIVKGNRDIVKMVTPFFWIRMVVSITSDSNAIREDMGEVSTSAAYRAEEFWLFLRFQRFVRSELSLTMRAPELLKLTVMPK
jgi:hypothetical protein